MTNLGVNPLREKERKRLSHQELSISENILRKATYFRRDDIELRKVNFDTSPLVSLEMIVGRSSQKTKLTCKGLLNLLALLFHEGHESRYHIGSWILESAKYPPHKKREETKVDKINI